MGSDNNDSELSSQLSREHQQNQAEIQQKRQRLFETALDIQRGNAGQSWIGEPL